MATAATRPSADAARKGGGRAIDAHFVRREIECADVARNGCASMARLLQEPGGFRREPARFVARGRPRMRRAPFGRCAAARAGDVLLGFTEEGARDVRVASLHGPEGEGSGRAGRKRPRRTSDLALGRVWR